MFGIFDSGHGGLPHGFMPAQAGIHALFLLETQL
jgi:hypothetical protein